MLWPLSISSIDNIFLILIRVNLDLLDEAREEARIKAEAVKRRV